MWISMLSALEAFSGFCANSAMWKGLNVLRASQWHGVKGSWSEWTSRTLLLSKRSQNSLHPLPLWINISFVESTGKVSIFNTTWMAEYLTWTLNQRSYICWIVLLALCWWLSIGYSHICKQTTYYWLFQPLCQVLWPGH